MAASGKSLSELPVLCFALKNGCCLQSGRFQEMEEKTCLEVLSNNETMNCNIFFVSHDGFTLQNIFRI